MKLENGIYENITEDDMYNALKNVGGIEPYYVVNKYGLLYKVVSVRQMADGYAIKTESEWTDEQLAIKHCNIINSYLIK